MKNSNFRLRQCFLFIYLFQMIMFSINLYMNRRISDGKYFATLVLEVRSTYAFDSISVPLH